MKGLFDSAFTWLSENEAAFAWAVSLSLVTFVGTLIAVPIVVIQMHTDYFLRTADEGLPRTPLRLVRRLLKNALGYVMIVAGILMLVLPGQGLLTIALGVSLVDFPGKRRLQLRIVRLRGVWRPVNWMRHKAGKPPLELPDA